MYASKFASAVRQLLPSFSRRANRPTRRSTQPRGVCAAVVDVLEARTMLSANPLAEATLTAASAGLVHSTLPINGTAGNDVIKLELGNSVYKLTYNGVVYNYNAATVSSIQINGLGGADTFQLVGTSGVDQVTLVPGAVELVGTGITVVGWNFELIQVASGGGDDVAYFYDSPGVDHYYGNADSASMTGAGYANDVYGFRRNYAYSYAGGADVAFLNDSVGNDRFVTQPTRSWMTDGNFYNSATRFERVYGYAYSGGFDSAILYDSAENDYFVARDVRSILGNASGEYYASASRFEAVYSHSLNGGNDRADLYGTIGNDTVISNPTTTKMYGGTYYYEVTSYKNVNALAGAGGTDVALVYDSSGNDHFYDNDTANEMVWSTGAGLWLFNFVAVDVIYNQGGIDTAEFRDLDPNDLIIGEDELVAVVRNNGKTITGDTMDRVVAQSNTSPGAQLDFDSIDWVFQKVGNW